MVAVVLVVALAAVVPVAALNALLLPAALVLAVGLAAAAGWVLFVIIMGITAIQFLGQKRWVHYD